MRRPWIILPLLFAVAGCGEKPLPPDVLSRSEYQQLKTADRRVKNMQDLEQVLAGCQHLTRSRYASCLQKGLHRQADTISSAAKTYAGVAQNIQGGCQKELVQEAKILNRLALRLRTIGSSLVEQDSQKFTQALKALKQDVQRLRKSEKPFTCKHQV